MENENSKSKTELWSEAINSGNVKDAEALLADDSSLVNTYVNHTNALMVATRAGNAAMVSLLLRHGARPSGLSVGMERHSWNALMIASREGFADVVEVLLNEGKEDPNGTANGTSPLIFAAHHHHLSVIKVLDKYGANMNIRAPDGANAIIETSRWTSQPPVIEYLLSRGVACDLEDDSGMTPLMYLANIGDIDSIRILVEKGGANLAHARASDGQTVLSIAERRKMSEVVCYCWKRGLTPTNIAMQCHLGELVVSRPRVTFPLGGRYLAAAASIGSKIFVYGGQATLSSKFIPVVHGMLANEGDDFPRATHTEEEILVPLSEKQDAPVPQDVRGAQDAWNDDEAQNEEREDEMAQDDDDGANDLDEPEDEFVARIQDEFEVYFDRLAQQAEENGEPPIDPAQALQNFLAALMNGEINLGNIAARQDVARGAGARVDADSDDSDNSDDEAHAAGKSQKAKTSNIGNVSVATGESSTRMEEDESSDSDSSDFSSSEGEEEDHSRGSRYARTAVECDTFVLDVDECEMETIFPNPQMQPKLQRFRLDTVRKGKWIHVDEDGLGGRTHNPPEDASFQPCLAFSKKAFHSRRGPFGYFELHVINPGPRRLLTMGLVPPNYPAEGKQPGWNKDSFGLHGDDGAIFCQAGSGDAFADRFEVGDVIGCGVYWPRKEVFFAVNGRFIGFAPTSVSSSRLYACVGVRNEDAAFRVNFGAEPFRFDFRAPTLVWSRISLAKPTNMAARQDSYQPRIEQPCFARQNNETHLVLFSRKISASSRNDIFLFNVKKMAYAKRKTKGSFPATNAPPMPNLSTPFEVAQPSPQRVFMFSPRDKSRPPILGMLDTETLEWFDIRNAHDAFAAYCLAQGNEDASPWLELISTLDAEEYQTCWFMTIDGKLVWTSNTSYIVADPNTGFFSQQNLSSKSITLTQNATQIGIQNSAVCFAGWDGHNQLNDIEIFKLNDGGWYMPTYSGIVPRARNHHSALLVHTRSAYFGLNALDLPSGLRLTEPIPIIINAFGWSGQTVMSDLDVFSFSTAPSDRAIDASFPSDLTLLLKSKDGDETTSLPAHKIVLFCRSSKFCQILTSSPSMDSYAVEVESVESFKGLIHFLYTDEIIRDPTWLKHHSRGMATLADDWAPELAPRLLERLLLTRSTLPSLFSAQMLVGFNNSSFADLTIEVADSEDAGAGMPEVIRIPVHKVILTSRSPYFKALLTGGMVESQQSTITIPDVPAEALKLVIEFLYTYEVPYDRCSEHIVDMFTLACRFQISKLKSTLENLLVFNLATENVCGLLLVAHAFSQAAPTLLKECVKFIESNMPELCHNEDYCTLLPKINPIIAAFHQSQH